VLLIADRDERIGAAQTVPASRAECELSVPASESRFQIEGVFAERVSCLACLTGLAPLADEGALSAFVPAPIGASAAY
jgi:hypothetical protein